MKIIACYSNKGGVGKTAAAVNLAHACAQSGMNTLLCDLDPQGAASFYYRVKPSEKLKKAKFFEDVEKFTRSIRGSDYDRLDILPSNMSYRDFDIFLSRMRNSRSRLKKALKRIGHEYDVMVLDCPPNISILSENIFRAADHVVVPVIPTTAAERTYEQLAGFFKQQKLKRKKLLPFFSMVQRQKKLHGETMARMTAQFRKSFLETAIPFSADVEKMGIHRAPVATFAGNRPAGKAFQSLWSEIKDRSTGTQ